MPAYASIGKMSEDPDPIEILSDQARLIVEEAHDAALVVRLTGSIAVQLKCPTYAALARDGRIIGDIDLVARKDQAGGLGGLLARLGYSEDREVFILSEGTRAIYEREGDSPIHLDVFFDKLDFCHVIAVSDRLEADSPTLPLAELFLAKAQIVQINEKDLVDMAVLLLEHELGEDDASGINVERIAGLCARDWGLWRTTSMNLDKLRRFVAASSAFGDAHRRRVEEQVAKLTECLGRAPKSLAWRMRARLGDRVKWYRDVDEVR